MLRKKKLVNNNSNLINDNNEIYNINELKLKGNETMNEVSFKFSDYFCCCFGIKNNRDINIRVFNFGVNFYRNQMNIINFFNIFFLTELMLTQFIYKKTNLINQAIDIPLK